MPSRRWSRFRASSSRLRWASRSFGAEEGRGVDALEHLVVLVAPPVGAGHGEELEGAGLDLARGGQVRPAAEVVEGALAVDGDGLVLAALVGQLRLVGLLLGVEERLGLLPGHLLAADRRVAGDDLAPSSPRCASRSSGAKGCGPVEVVVEAVLDDGADGDLGLGEELLHGVGHEVRAGVPVDVQGLGGPVGEELDGAVPGEREVDIHEAAVHLGRQGTPRPGAARCSRPPGGPWSRRGMPLRPVGEGHLDFGHRHS